MRNLSTLALAPFFLSLLFCVVWAEPSPNPESGIEGVITIGPIHGGPMREGEPNSRPFPNAAFVVRRGTAEVASFETDADGKYRVALPPGQYEVLARNQTSKIGHWGPFPVDISAGKWTRADFTCDSGMR